MAWIGAYIVIAFPLGWLFFQQPKASVHFERLGIFEVWLWGMSWPIVLSLSAISVMYELLRDR